jgi:hypothetical protein
MSIPLVKKIRWAQVPCSSVAKLVKHAVIRLLHLCTNVVYRISKLSDLLGQELDAVNRVTKDNALADLNLVKRVFRQWNLLSFFNVSIELRDTAEGKFVHEINGFGTNWLQKP